ncbi:hypothetical protein [Streptomyces monashensis]|uniref:hypothetical protein n=1 Tax=Streptomyces monashensis TaxID=1678012 RepID=UPI000AFF6967|nr:hypothetical protein [Streptomyces monashensis]
MDPANLIARHPFGPLAGWLVTAAARADAATPGALAKAKKRAATTAGLVVSTRACFGFTAAPGTTDDARIRDITQALPPVYADRLLTARESAGWLDDTADTLAAQMQGAADDAKASGINVCSPTRRATSPARACAVTRNRFTAS